MCLQEFLFKKILYESLQNEGNSSRLEICKPDNTQVYQVIINFVVL